VDGVDRVRQAGDAGVAEPVADDHGGHRVAADSKGGGRCEHAAARSGVGDDGRAINTKYDYDRVQVGIGGGGLEGDTAVQRLRGAIGRAVQDDGGRIVGFHDDGKGGRRPGDAGLVGGPSCHVVCGSGRWDIARHCPTVSLVDGGDVVAVVIECDIQGALRSKLVARRDLPGERIVVAIRPDAGEGEVQATVARWPWIW